MGSKRQKQLWPPSAREGASFFKVMIGDFKHTLKVPPSFTRYIEARRKFILKSYIAGKSWRVEVKGFASSLSFQEGWGKFVEDHAIGLGEFLVFMYDGESGFDVDVYGTDGCKKGHFEGDTNVEPSQEMTYSEKVIHPLGYPHSRSRKEVLVFGRTKSGPLRMGWRRRMPKKERELEAALPFKPGNPYFVAVWRTTRANYMTIPRALAKEYTFGEKKHTTLLRDHLGRSWHVKISLRNDGRIDFTKGWSEFSRGNFLTEGDVCVFEFIQAGNVIQTYVLQVEKGTGKLVKKCGQSSRSMKVMNNSRSVTSCLEESVLQLPRSYGSHYSDFIASLKWSQLHQLTIPGYLVSKHDLGAKGSIALHDPCGRTWPVDVHRRADGGADLGAGWEGFARGNNLRDGDACAFEFAHGGDPVRVQILRVGDSDVKREAPQGDLDRTST